MRVRVFYDFLASTGYPYIFICAVGGDSATKRSDSMLAYIHICFSENCIVMNAYHLPDGMRISLNEIVFLKYICFRTKRKTRTVTVCNKCPRRRLKLTSDPWL